MKIYNKTNFHKHTFCIFNEVSPAEIADREINFESKSGSSYYFTEAGVYRKSNHWGRAANCKWRLQSTTSTPSRTKVGFALWTHFHSINDTEPLYYIEVDFASKTVQYYHKGVSAEDNLYLRNAALTTKRVKEIRELLANDKKLKYWDFTGSFEQFLEKVVRLLITTNLSLLQIKDELQK